MVGVLTVLPVQFAGVKYVLEQERQNLQMLLLLWFLAIELKSKT